MVSADAAGAVAWLLETARAALAAGERIDLDTVLVLRSLAPRDPLVAHAIEQLNEEAEAVQPADLAARARRTAAAIRVAVDVMDEQVARQVVSDLETELLAAYRPGQSLGSLDADVAMASLLLDIWDIGGQPPHQMLAEELMLVALRVHGAQRHEASFTVRSEAARTFARLYRLTGKRDYHDEAVALLSDFHATYREHGLGAARYVLALHAIG